MKRKDLVTLGDCSGEEILGWLKLAQRLKRELKSGKQKPLLKGKNLAMIFQKSSTRTRVSFEVAMNQLGGQALHLAGGELQLGRGETIADTARVLSRYVDAIMARVYKHSDIEGLARHASVPVINGLSDFSHPCQGLADYLTVWEKKKSFKGIKLVYVGDGNNVAHSLIFGGAKLGVSVTCVTPAGYEPSHEVMDAASRDAKKTGAAILVTQDVREGVKGADIIYTDVWASMGQESEAADREKIFQHLQINSSMLGMTGKKDTLVMHCLPAHRGHEITDEVTDGPQSVVFDQAENRLHAQKALLVSLMAPS